MKSFEEREEEYEKTRARIFSQQPLQGSRSNIAFDLANAPQRPRSRYVDGGLFFVETHVHVNFLYTQSPASHHAASSDGQRYSPISSSLSPGGVKEGWPEQQSQQPECHAPYRTPPAVCRTPPVVCRGGGRDSGTVYSRTADGVKGHSATQSPATEDIATRGKTLSQSEFGFLVYCPRNCSLLHL